MPISALVEQTALGRVGLPTRREGGEKSVEHGVIFGMHHGLQLEPVPD